MSAVVQGFPERIGPFRVLRPIASGGMAEVYEVEHPDTREHLALKLLVDETESARRRFDREYAVMNALNHPNIVRVYRYGLHGTQPWMSMELVEGTPIQAYARDQGKAGTADRTAEVVRVCYDVALALDHIHTRGLLHRDLKSANLLVLSDGRVKLFDFGAARFVAGGSELTLDREFLGTFAYASPEQLRSKELDHRSDIYSFGVLIYRLLCAKRPFWSENPHELARMHVRDLPPPLSARVALPEGLEDLVLEMLAKDPDARPQSGRAVSERLQAGTSVVLGAAPALQIGSAANRVVGREEQLAELRGFLHRPSLGEALVLVGSEGCGVSAIRDAAAAMAATAPPRFLSASFSEGDDWEVLRALLGEVGLSEPQLEGGAVAGPEAFAAMVSESLVAVTARTKRVVLLCIKNLHFASDRTLALLGALVPLLPISGAGLVGDWTTREDAPRSRLEAAMPGSRQIRLGALSPLEVARFVGALLHRRPPPIAVAQRIHAATGGLPEHVEATVEALVAEKRLLVGGPHGLFVRWSSDDALAIPLLPGARARLEARLELVPLDHLRILEALAVLDAPCSTALVASMLEREVADVAHSVSQLTELSWLRVEDDRVVWQHSLACQLVLARLRRSRRDLLERRAVDLVDQLDDGPARVRWLLRADRRADAERVALEVARTALDDDQPSQAQAVCEPLLALSASTDLASSQTISELHLRHAQALLMRSPDRMVVARDLLRARAIQRGDDPVFRARLFLARARAWRRQGHYANHRKYLDRALREARRVSHRGLEGTIAASLGQVCRLVGRTAEAERWYAFALERAAVDDRILAAARAGLGSVALARGRLTEALEHAQAAIDVGNVYGLAVGLPVLVDANRLRGTFTEGLAPLYRHLAVLRQVEASHYLVDVLLVAARVEVAIGRLGRAQEHVDELAATLRRGEDLHLRLEMSLIQARILLDSDEVADAALLLDDTVHRGVDPGLRPQVARGYALMAETAWRQGDTDHAEVLYDKARLLASGLSDIPVAVSIACSQSRVDDVTDPATVFGDLAKWAETEGADFVQMWHRVADTRWLGSTDRVSAIRRAKALLAKVEAKQETTDRQALRVHPWGRHLNALDEVT